MGFLEDGMTETRFLKTVLHFVVKQEITPFNGEYFYASTPNSP